ncbi:hypothetical protein AAMO2058_000500400 [Amorphochlora amoebiformis]
MTWIDGYIDHKRGMANGGHGVLSCFTRERSSVVMDRFTTTARADENYRRVLRVSSSKRLKQAELLRLGDTCSVWGEQAAHGRSRRLRCGMVASCVAGRGFYLEVIEAGTSHPVYRAAFSVVFLLSLIFLYCHGCRLWYGVRGVGKGGKASQSPFVRSAQVEIVIFNVTGVLVGGVKGPLLSYGGWETDRVTCYWSVNVGLGIWCMFNLAGYRFLLAKTRVTDAMSQFSTLNRLVWWALHTVMVAYYAFIGVLMLISDYRIVTLDTHPNPHTTCRIDFVFGLLAAKILVALWSILDTILSVAILVLLVLPLSRLRLQNTFVDTIRRNAIGGVGAIVSTGVTMFLITDSISCMGSFENGSNLVLGMFDELMNLLCLNLIYTWTLYVQQVLALLSCGKMGRLDVRVGSHYNSAQALRNRLSSKGSGSNNNGISINTNNNNYSHKSVRAGLGIVGVGTGVGGGGSGMGGVVGMGRGFGKWGIRSARGVESGVVCAPGLDIGSRMRISNSILQVSRPALTTSLEDLKEACEANDPLPVGSCRDPVGPHRDPVGPHRDKSDGSSIRIKHSQTRLKVEAYM